MNFQTWKIRGKDKREKGERDFSENQSQPDGKKDKMQCVVPIGMRCTPGFSSFAASSLIRQLFSLKRSMSTQLKLTFHRNKGSSTREREREKKREEGREGGRMPQGAWKFLSTVMQMTRPFRKYGKRRRNYYHKGNRISSL